MTRDDIIRMAREARMPYFFGTWEIANLDGLERFAALVAAYERQWVGLDDDEYQTILGQLGDAGLLAFYTLIESKLKEKNSG